MIPTQMSPDQLGTSMEKMDLRSTYMSVDKGTPHRQSQVLQRYSAIDFGPLNIIVDEYGKSKDHFNNFSGASYLCTTPLTEMTLYRLYGGGARADGQYWTTELREGNEAFRIDAAVLQKWNDLTERKSIVVPNGIFLYEGLCAPQKEGIENRLGRGCWQIFIPFEVLVPLLSANEHRAKGNMKKWDEEIEKAKTEQSKFMDKFHQSK